MGWLDRCYETYEKNLSEVGNIAKRGDKDAPMLLPVAHTTQKAHVEISLSASGEFLFARIVRPDEATTVIPCTEESSERTRRFAPHPLADKLQSVAGDYTLFGGKKSHKFDEYINQLSAWCESPHSNDKVRAVLKYAEKGTVIADLVCARILVTGDDGKLITNRKNYKGEKPLISGVLADETECFVRWRVDGVSLHDSKDVWQSWIDYYESLIAKRGICYVTGQETVLSRLSPKKIRSSKDGARLVSSNDSTNFTFRGERFSNAEQALHIGYETTQKAHSALRWLIGKQGIFNGGQTILVWGTENEDLPPITADTYDFIGEDDLEDVLSGEGESIVDTTRTAFAELFNRKASGYNAELEKHHKISVIIIDSASENKGRISIKYYLELEKSKLIGNITNWHETLTWRHSYRRLANEQSKGENDGYITFYGAPSPADIAKAAYGEKADKKLINHTIERLIPCIIEGKALPRDIMLSAVHRVPCGSQRKYWESSKVRSIACSLVLGYHNRKNQDHKAKENFTMALNENCTDRSYLFGRILACADAVEYKAESVAGVKKNERHPTNAQRLEAAFVRRPAKTCEVLKLQLIPYVDRLIKNGASTYAYDLMLELIVKLSEQNYNNKPLNELYLLGYASQRQEFFTSRKDKNAGDGENS